MAFDAGYNQVFFKRLTNWSKQTNDLRREGQDLVDTWNSLAVSGDPDFTDVGGVTTAEATALVTMLGDFKDWVENVAPTQGDRVAVLAPFLGE